MSVIPLDSHSAKRAAAQRFSAAVLRNLPASVKCAAEILCAKYEMLDIEVVTTLEDAACDLYAAMPPLENHQNEMRCLVDELVADIEQNFKGARDMPLRLRFAYQNEQDLIDRLLPQNAARITVMPVKKNVSIHASIEEA